MTELRKPVKKGNRESIAPCSLSQGVVKPTGERGAGWYRADTACPWPVAVMRRASSQSAFVKAGRFGARAA
jgi:hypothetical protein